MNDGSSGIFVPDAKRMLVDRSLEIPPFLRRTADGGFEYPGIPVPLAPVAGATGDRYRPVTPDPEAERMAASAERDRRTAEAIRRATGEEERARTKEHSRAAAQKRKLDKQKKTEITKTQRKTFRQHFTWDFEK